MQKIIELLKEVKITVNEKNFSLYNYRNYGEENNQMPPETECCLSFIILTPILSLV